MVGADINLATLGAFLARHKVTPSTELALVNGEGELVAHERIAALLHAGERRGAMPQLAELRSAPLAQLFQQPLSGQERALSRYVDGSGAVWRTAAVRMFMEESQDLRLLMAIPDAELTADARRQLKWSALATLLIIVLSIPLTWVLARAISQPLRRLVRDVDAIRHFDFQQPIQVTPLVKETRDLAVTLQGMQATIRRFLDLSMAVASEEQFDRLLPRLLRETVLTAGAATGVLYLADGQRLVPSSALCPDGTALDPQALGQLAAPQMPGPAAPGAGEDASNVGPLMDTALSEGRVCSRPITA